MAVYFDTKLQFPNPGEHLEMCWHPMFPVLAVATDHPATRGTVDLFMQEGELVTDAVIRRAAAPTCLAWHPQRRILASGFDTGEVLLWNDHDKELYQMPELHSAMISVLAWNSNGTKLMSGDSDGNVALWKADQKGRLQYTPVVKHNLSSPVVRTVLRPPDQAIDIKSLARAAVSGDESALDMFTWRKGKGSSKVGLAPGEQQGFFLGCDNGTVHYLHESGKCTQAFAMQDGISKLLYYEDRGILVTVTRNMNLSQHQVNNDGDCKQIMKVKLGGRSDKLEIIMVGRGLLASASGEAVVRIWDFEREENYILTLDQLTAKDGQTSLTLYERNIAVTSISYCPLNETLVAGTTCGQVASWQYDGRLSWERRHEPESRWKLQPPARVEGAVTQVQWQQRSPLLAVNTEHEVFLLSEQSISYHYNDQISIVQNGANFLSVNNYRLHVYKDFKTDLQIKGVYTTKEYVGVWNGKQILTYEYSEDGQDITAAGTILSETRQVCMFEQNLYSMEKGRVQVRTMQGTIKQTINLTELEGEPVSLDVCGGHLVIGTSGGFVKIYDISRREAKQLSTPKHLPELVPGFGQIESVRVNCSGTRVSVIARTVQGIPDPKLYVWDVEQGTLAFFNLESGRGEQDDFDAEAEQAADDIYNTDEERGKNQAAKDIAGRYPHSHFWDKREPKLLVLEARLIRSGLSHAASRISHASSYTSAAEDKTETMVVSLFSTSENGILLQDSFSLAAGHSRLIGLEVPHYYFIRKPEELSGDDSDETPSIQSPRPQDSSPAKLVARRTMRDFVGLESTDKNTMDAMMNFSYYLAIGNMDDAFRSIKLIKNESVWENMAKMCVKSRRLDVAAVCLGNMGHARGAKALREARAMPELDAQVAVLAIQLGLVEDAERLLKNCGRYDILNDLYQSSGQWNKAIEIADMFDRVHLRRTYYNYAKHLESLGDVNTAIPNFEKSDTHRFEVPRMLFDEPQALEAYIVKTKDKALHKWWAQYMESAGEMEAALQFYEAAQDYLSLVRVYCYCGNLDKAADICNETGDPAACYHLARQYENQERIKEAIHFFTRAQAYGNAIRLCKEHGMEDQMMNLALLGKPEDMMEAARFYEHRQGYQDKAVMLYHKAGNVGKALELAFRTRQFGALQHISESLDNRADPELLGRCAAFFMENDQYDKAVDLLATGKKYTEALSLCLDQNVEMTEELAEKLTPDKEELDGEGRTRILNGIAEVCMQQRQYHLATKKYTQSGNKLQAMKALLKSGDTEKIIFFAGVSRQKEIYVMAANYLQSLDWRKEPEIMKNIIGFYTKGRALDSLASFYDACSQVEIDEYQNYEKAVGALGEAHKCLSKAKLPNQSQQEERLADLARRIELIKKFVHARRLYEAEAEESMKMCQLLLEEEDLDSAVRVGDVFGFMAEHFAKREKWRSALSCMEELQRRQPKVNLSYFISPKTVHAVYKALNMAAPKTQAVNGHDLEDETEGEVVDEDVVDDFLD